MVMQWFFIILQWFSFLEQSFSTVRPTPHRFERIHRIQSPLNQSGPHRSAAKSNPETLGEHQPRGNNRAIIICKLVSFNP